MSEQVRRWGSIGILSTIGGSLLGASIIWLFKTVTEVKPLMQAVTNISRSIDKIEESNRKSHEKLIELIELDQKNMMMFENRIQRVEIMCEMTEKSCVKKEPR